MRMPPKLLALEGVYQMPSSGDTPLFNLVPVFEKGRREQSGRGGMEERKVVGEGGIFLSSTVCPLVQSSHPFLIQAVGGSV